MHGLGLKSQSLKTGWDCSPSPRPVPRNPRDCSPSPGPVPPTQHGPQSQSLRPVARLDVSPSPGLGLCVSWIPKRKLPLTNEIINAMLAVYDGARRGSLVVERGSYYWTALFAAFAVLAESGERKDEVPRFVFADLT